MYLKSSLIFILVVLSFKTFCVEKNLPELLTKQTASNIRFFSDDGTVTYFQKNSGTLHLTHHYQTWDLLKLAPLTQYYVTVSPIKKKVIVEANENWLSAQQFFKDRIIYEADFLGKTLSKIGMGIDAKLQLNDTWVSFFDGKKKEINLLKLGATSTPITIKSKHKVNPYFLPQVIMLNETTVVLTEMTPDGYQVLYKFDVLTGSFVQIYKSSSPGTKLEICQNNNILYLGQFSIGDVRSGSSIFSIELEPNFTLKKMDLIYSSTKNDFGNIICEASSNEIYFIQAQTSENEINIKNTELVQLKVNNKEISVLSQFGDASQIIRMDHRILIPYRGKFYVAKGENNVKTDELQKKKEDKKEFILEEGIEGAEESL
jgi:WD40 repeat protein